MEKFKIEPFVVNSRSSDHYQFDEAEFKIEKDTNGDPLFKVEGKDDYSASKENFVDEAGNSIEKDCFKINENTYLDLQGYVLAADGSRQLRDETKFTNKELKEHESKFKRENNGKTLDAYLSEHPNSKTLEENKQLYCHLTDIKESAENDESFKQRGKVSFSNEKNEMFLGVEMIINGRESPFRFIVRDGQVVFPEGASPTELKEMMAFLNARGISGFDFPENLEKIQEAVQQEVLEEKEINSKNVESIPNAIESEPVAATSEAAKKEITMKDIKKCMDGWAERNGKKKSLSYFERSPLGSSWTTWTVFPNQNRDNMSNLGKKDKDGNRKSLFDAQISARLKNGKLEVRYCLPIGGKITPMVAEQLIELHAMNGAKKIKFSGVRDHDLKEIRTACAKKLIVPIGIGLKISSIEDMYQEAVKSYGDCPQTLDYKKRLAERLRTNILSKNKPMNDAEQKFYDDTMEQYRTGMKKSEIKAYKKIFEDSINVHLDRENINKNDITNYMAARYAAADVYEIFADVATTGDKTVSRIEAKLAQIHNRMKYDSIQFVDKDGKEKKIESPEVLYQKFIVKAGLTGKESLSDLTPEHYDDLMDVLKETRKAFTKSMMIDLYNDVQLNTKSAENLSSIINKGRKTADDYFNKNFIGAYTGVVGKDNYSVLPAAADGLTFTWNKEGVVDSKQDVKEREGQNQSSRERLEQTKSSVQGGEQKDSRKNPFSSKGTNTQVFPKKQREY